MLESFTLESLIISAKLFTFGCVIAKTSAKMCLKQFTSVNYIFIWCFNFHSHAKKLYVFSVAICQWNSSVFLQACYEGPQNHIHFNLADFFNLKITFLVINFLLWIQPHWKVLKHHHRSYLDYIFMQRISPRIWSSRKSSSEGMPLGNSKLFIKPETCQINK